jgi:hypothetical protein
MSQWNNNSEGKVAVSTNPWMLGGLFLAIIIVAAVAMISHH